jgi:hypothetical protein
VCGLLPTNCAHGNLSIKNILETAVRDEDVPIIER